MPSASRRASPASPCAAALSFPTAPPCAAPWRFPPPRRVRLLRPQGFPWISRRGLTKKAFNTQPQARSKQIFRLKNAPSHPGGAFGPVRLLSLIHISLSPMAAKILKMCILEARILKSATADAEHVLLAILKDGDNLAATVLRCV